jgi:urease accessory protein
MLITKLAAKSHEYQADFPEVEYLELTWEELVKRRLRAKTDRGREIEIAFPEGGQLADGDLLAVAGNTGIIVKTLPERVLCIQPPKSAVALNWLCYELGNRHLHAWLSAEKILVLYDPLVKEFLIQHQITVTEEFQVFSEPEFLAVGGGMGHHHRPHGVNG